MKRSSRELNGILAAGLTFALAWAIPAVAGTTTPDKVSRAAAVPLRGGVFEASGVSNVPGTSGVLFVDDGTADAVFWAELDGSGHQKGDAVRVPLGTSVTDPEGITNDGRRFYVAGSQSKTKGGAGIVRFRFDPATRTASEVDVFSDLEDFLLSNIPELADAAGSSGINIEGLAWDPGHGRLLLGLRGPLSGDEAVVVPISLAAAGGPLSKRNLRVEPLVRLPLDGMGIRAIEYDDRARVFLVIAGATDKKTRVDFTLWEWSGVGTTARAVSTIDRDLKPEGVARVGQGILVTCDIGSYVVLNR
ncbi:MAG: DUF3616 domain-containing protein [Acidobacteria bacterium]|nr:DUF3616 domain-containing protein [Acidobacteriota bacterium]